MPNRAIELVRQKSSTCAREREARPIDAGYASAVFRRAAPPDARAYAIHDARNLLGIMILDLDFLRGSRQSLTPQAAEALVDLEAAASRLREHLEVALGEGQARALQEPVYRPVRIAQILELVTAATGRRRALPRGVQMRVEATSDDVVEVDPSLLGRVLANLIDNAIRHSPDGGTVTVSAHTSGGWLELTVTDQGAGVAHELADVIFEPYFTAADGHGLGLSFCKDVALAHGGTIEVHDEHPGARFVVAIPTERGA